MASAFTTYAFATSTVPRGARYGSPACGVLLADKVGESLTLIGLAVDVAISGPAARVVWRAEFYNSTHKNQDVFAVFPLPLRWELLSTRVDYDHHILVSECSRSAGDLRVTMPQGSAETAARVASVQIPWKVEVGATLLLSGTYYAPVCCTWPRLPQSATVVGFPLPVELFPVAQVPPEAVMEYNDLHQMEHREKVATHESGEPQHTSAASLTSSSLALRCKHLPPGHTIRIKGTMFYPLLCAPVLQRVMGAVSAAGQHVAAQSELVGDSGFELAFSSATSPWAPFSAEAGESTLSESIDVAAALPFSTHGDGLLLGIFLKPIAHALTLHVDREGISAETDDDPRDKRAVAIHFTPQVSTEPPNSEVIFVADAGGNSANWHKVAEAVALAVRGVPATTLVNVLVCPTGASPVSRCGVTGIHVAGLFLFPEQSRPASAVDPAELRHFILEVGTRASQLSASGAGGADGALGDPRALQDLLSLMVPIQRNEETVSRSELAQRRESMVRGFFSPTEASARGSTGVKRAEEVRDRRSGLRTQKQGEVMAQLQWALSAQRDEGFGQRCGEAPSIVDGYVRDVVVICVVSRSTATRAASTLLAAPPAEATSSAFFQFVEALATYGSRYSRVSCITVADMTNSLAAVPALHLVTQASGGQFRLVDEADDGGVADSLVDALSVLCTRPTLTDVTLTVSRPRGNAVDSTDAGELTEADVHLACGRRLPVVPCGSQLVLYGLLSPEVRSLAVSISGSIGAKKCIEFVAAADTTGTENAAAHAGTRHSSASAGLLHLAASAARLRYIVEEKRLAERLVQADAEEIRLLACRSTLPSPFTHVVVRSLNTSTRSSPGDTDIQSTLDSGSRMVPRGGDAAALDGTGAISHFICEASALKSTAAVTKPFISTRACFAWQLQCNLKGASSFAAIHQRQSGEENHVWGGQQSAAMLSTGVAAGQSLRRPQRSGGTEADMYMRGLVGDIADRAAAAAIIPHSSERAVVRELVSLQRADGSFALDATLQACLRVPGSVLVAPHSQMAECKSGSGGAECGNRGDSLWATALVVAFIREHSRVRRRASSQSAPVPPPTTGALDVHAALPVARLGLIKALGYLRSYQGETLISLASKSITSGVETLEALPSV